ncbi:MBL fold metallo-hydrolase [Novosphingobium soli]|uniref:MBL fold metallo-hydrolase n=1 Tax=Novosphingobium soli TaxID=574956 RepID=UPI00363BCAE1
MSRSLPPRLRAPLLARLLAPLFVAAVIPATAAAQEAGAAVPDAGTAPAWPVACAGKDGWADPGPPARIFANTWYVGTCGISAILITGEEGHVLIDGGVARAAPLVLANIRSAGFDPQDVRWILASHEHLDHVGALAALKQATGAKVAALPVQKAVLETGRTPPQDPQAARIAPLRSGQRRSDPRRWREPGGRPDRRHRPRHPGPRAGLHQLDLAGLQRRPRLPHGRLCRQRQHDLV